MTQSHIDDVSIACLVQQLERIRYLEKPKKLNISPNQAYTLQRTWGRFAKGELDKAGLAMFLEMFEIKKDTKPYFEFAKGVEGGEQLKSNSRMLFHVSRVAWHIEQVLRNMDNLEDVVPILKQVGGRHNVHGYNIPPTVLPTLGVALVNCIRRAHANCEEKFTDNDAAAWKELFGWIVCIMQEGMKEY